MIAEHALDKALIVDLEQRLGVTGLLSWLDAKADELAQLGYLPGEGVQFSSDLLRARHIVGYFPRRTLAGDHASITLSSRGYVISYRNDLPFDRIRFSVAHEIGHTFWFKQAAPGEPISPLQSNAAGMTTIEALCDFFAGALLLPRRQMKDICSAYGPNDTPPLHLISHIAREFQVADQAVARRLLYQLYPQRAAVLKLCRKRDSRSRSNDQGWRTSWCATPTDIRRAHERPGLRVPFLTGSRTIPEDMVPTLVGNVTERHLVDGRWAAGLTPQSVDEAKLAFRHRSSGEDVEAFVVIADQDDNLSLFDEPGMGCLYIAIPLSWNNSP
jgi:Zn-dependent peptidase ImmA (M78 family)